MYGTGNYIIVGMSGACRMCCSLSCRYVSPFHRPRRHLGRVEVWLYSIFDFGTRRRRGVSITPPPRTLPPGKTQYPLYRRLGGPQGRSGQVRKVSPPPGFDPRTVQPVGSRYTDCANRPTPYHVHILNSYPSVFMFYRLRE